MQNNQYQPCKSPIRAIIIFSLMSIFLCFEMALQVSPAVMTHQLTTALGLTPFLLGLMTGVYYVTYTAMQIPSGLMYDRANFRILVCTAILICAAGIGLFATSANFYEGALARMLTGFGSAFAFLSVLTVAARCFDPKYFAMLTGIAQLLAAIGGMAGQLPIAWLVHRSGWRDTSVILMVFGIVLMIVVWTFIGKPVNQKQRVRSDEPMWQSIKAIIRHKQTWLIAAYGFFDWAPITAFASLWGVPYIRTAYHLSLTDASWLSSLVWLGIGCASPIVGRLSDQFQRRKPPLLIMAFIGFISVTIILYGPHLPIAVLGLLLFLMGTGSSGQIVSFASVKDRVAPQRLSAAIGFNNMALVATGFVMQPLIGKLLSWHTQTHSIAHLSLNDYHFGLSLLPACYFVCVLLVLFGIKETHGQA